MALTIGEVAKRSGIGLETVRFYERKGHCQVNGTKPKFPKTTGVPHSLNRRTSPLSNRKKPGLEGVDDERPKDDDGRLETGSGSDRELRENAESVPLI